MLDDAQQAVLLLGIEDRCGLWEITRERALYEKPRDQQIQLAGTALKALVAQGLVRVFRRREEDVEIGPEELERVLLNPSSWCVPEPGSMSICFETTPSGAEIYWETVEQ